MRDKPRKSASDQLAEDMRGGFGRAKGRASTPQLAYRAAEAQLLVKPAFFEELP